MKSLFCVALLAVCVCSMGYANFICMLTVESDECNKESLKVNFHYFQTICEIVPKSNELQSCLFRWPQHQCNAETFKFFYYSPSKTCAMIPDSGK